MSFILLLCLVFLLFIMFMRYRKLYSVILMIAFLLGVTTAFLMYGLDTYHYSESIFLFNSRLPRNEFIHLMIAWYAVDFIASTVVVRNYREYRKVNFPQK